MVGRKRRHPVPRPPPPMDEREAIGPSDWERTEDLTKASFVAQMSCSEELLMEAQPHNVKQDSTKGLQDIWEKQWQEFLKNLQAPDMESGTSQMSDQLTPWDDARTFLASFEQVATACQWPRDYWVAFLQPALSGEAEQAFNLLCAQDRANYEKVKVAILEEEAITRERQRQYFRQLHYQDTEGPRGIYGQLRELGCRWLKVERHTKDEILELLILEQFLSILPADMQIWVRKHTPGSCTQAVALAEDFLLKRKEAAKFELNVEEFKDPEAGVQVGHVKRSKGVPPTEEAVEPSETGQALDCWAAQLSRDTKEGDEQVWVKEVNSIHRKGQEQTDPKDVSLETNKDFQNCKNGATLEGPSERGNLSVMGPEKGVGLTIFSTDDPGNAPEQQKFLGDQVQSTKSNHRGNFGQSSDLLPHQSTDTAGKSYLSSQDGNSLMSTEAFITQSGVYTGPGSMKCSHCDQHFNSASSFKKHLSTHNGESSFICCYCGRNFASSSILWEHLQVHMGGRLYRCPKCGKSFNQKHSLTIHKRLHSGKKPYQCLYCGKSFLNKFQIVMHERIHTGENPFVCSECGKGFNQKGNLMTHMRLHTGEKPYKCALCERQFNQKAGLSAHEKTHIGLKRTF